MLLHSYHYYSSKVLSRYYASSVFVGESEYFDLVLLMTVLFNTYMWQWLSLYFGLEYGIQICHRIDGSLFNTGHLKSIIQTLSFPIYGLQYVDGSS